MLTAISSVELITETIIGCDLGDGTAEFDLAAKEIEIINDIIMKELANQIINEDSKKIILEIMERMMKEDGIEAVILGCTEIPLLIDQTDTDIPLFDTTEIHTDYIVAFALNQ